MSPMGWAKSAYVSHCFENMHVELIANDSKDGNLNTVYINERGRIVFTGLSSFYLLCYYIVGVDHASLGFFGLNGLRKPGYVLPSDYFRDWNSLMCRTSWDKNHLIEIYDALYNFLDTRFSKDGYEISIIPGSVYFQTQPSFPVDSLVVVGKIPLELTKWDVEWEVDNKRCSAPFPMHRCD